MCPNATLDVSISLLSFEEKEKEVLCLTSVTSIFLLFWVERARVLCHIFKETELDWWFFGLVFLGLLVRRNQSHYIWILEN